MLSCNLTKYRKFPFHRAFLICCLLQTHSNKYLIQQAYFNFLENVSCNIQVFMEKQEYVAQKDP